MMGSKGTDDAGLPLAAVVELVAAAAAAAATAPNEEELSVEFDPCRSLIVNGFRCWFINDPNNGDANGGAATCLIPATLDLVFIVFFIVVDPSI